MHRAGYTSWHKTLTVLCQLLHGSWRQFFDSVIISLAPDSRHKGINSSRSRIIIRKYPLYCRQNQKPVPVIPAESVCLRHMLLSAMELGVGL